MGSVTVTALECVVVMFPCESVTVTAWVAVKRTEHELGTIAPVLDPTSTSIRCWRTAGLGGSINSCFIRSGRAAVVALLVEEEETGEPPLSLTVLLSQLVMLTATTGGELDAGSTTTGTETPRTAVAETPSHSELATAEIRINGEKVNMFPSSNTLSGEVVVTLLLLRLLLLLFNTHTTNGTVALRRRPPPPSPRETVVVVLADPTVIDVPASKVECTTVTSAEPTIGTKPS
jgi:hypothetical protein